MKELSRWLPPWQPRPASLSPARSGFQEERRQSERLQRRAATLEKFSTASYGLNPEMPIEESLTAVAEGIRESTPFRVVLISVYEPETGLLRRVAGAGIEPETLTELRARKQQLSSLRQLTKPEFRISKFVLHSREPDARPAGRHPLRLCHSVLGGLRPNRMPGIQTIFCCCRSRMRPAIPRASSAWMTRPMACGRIGPPSNRWNCSLARCRRSF